MERDIYETYAEYQAVCRKSKKKKRQRSKQFSSPEEFRTESNSQLEELANESPVNDDNVSEEESDDVTTKNVFNKLEKQANPENVYPSGSHVYRDVMVYAPPVIRATPEEEKSLANQEFYYSSENLGSKGTIKIIHGEPIEEQASEETSLLNTKALSKFAMTYELEKFQKNALVIFNQENVDGHQRRLGTERDVESLTKTFENFGFEVVEHKDLTKDEVFKELKTFTDRDFTDYGCVAVAVLTHGSNDGLLRARDQQYSEIEIINYFKVLNRPTLVTKPKIIIIQACRGTRIVPGTPVFLSGKVRKDVDDELEPYILPVEADMLILHSSYGGSPSHRNELHGTWFIQALCNKINTLAPTEDLESIITEVKRDVAINKQHEEYNKKTLQLDINKQMPVTTSTLIRKLFLRKFGDGSNPQYTLLDTKRESISCESKNEVHDNAIPTTPLLIQFGPCSCFLDHYNYMRTCLQYFIDENPNDEMAQNFLEIANTFEEGVEFNTAKAKMSKAIGKYLMSKTRSCQYFKYLYFYKH
uniref:Caspase-4 n=1 Tax=Lymantria monacha TaxID=78897 RepID=G0XQG8_9NEOP|nr:caspase-4 [Lymantria monacha]